MDYSPPGSSVHGILQAGILEWIAIPFSRGCSQPRDWTRVSCIAGGFFTVWVTREASERWKLLSQHDLNWHLSYYVPCWIYVDYTGRMYRNMYCGIVIYSKKCSWSLFLAQFNSVTQSCSTFCDPMDCSRPGIPVLHHLPEFAQTLVHWVGDATQLSCPLLSPSPAFNLSQHQGLF